MNLNTVSGNEIEAKILGVIPNAEVTVKNNTLHELKVGDIRIVVGSYAIEVTEIVRPKQWVASAKVEGTEVVFTHKEQAGVTELADAFNEKLKEPVLFTITEKTL